ncbi:cytidylate kinase [Sphaerisporangium krabiense]|uniref:Cytidylate kinase n=1 Tax=Sphaerisporangium krabiense TaxID=763782 RepID=A0A7W8Z8M2_9ACTN|nr:(d)CMP kinase [Sphaerisporangium krabiense]MBB5629434.1 cytidylate kinase [Sphaerisporangium krabiense]GII65716.1 cytidylate kinase [Sphaerisporangium krabiense]
MTALVVAMDGPSGSGKSSASRGVARALGLRYLDTGAMYRAITWWMLEHGVEVGDPAAVAARAGEPALTIATDPDAPGVTVDGREVSAEIRTHEVTSAVSAVSAVPEVRARLVAEQRALIDGGDIVVEGRDIGSVVAPGAPVKVYLTASPEARARRRSAELTGTTVEAQRLAMARRDTLDSTRKADPLVMAADAVELDTTELNLDEVISEVLRLVKERT